MISLDEARRLISSHVVAGPVVEMDHADALGRVLAESLVAGAFYPDGDRGTMDGYVIRAAESPGSFQVTGEAQAGAAPAGILGKGEAMRIFTGALLPEGGGRVIPQEEVRREGDLVHIGSFPESRFIRAKGSEAGPQDIVLRQGKRLGAAELAILAQIGAVRLRVIAAPVIHHLATGSELVAPDQIPGRGEIRDSNSSLLGGLLESMGMAIAKSRRVADDPDRIAGDAVGDYDVLLISGGASVGDYDFGARVLQRLGFTVHFDQVNLRPGKPLTFATRGKQVAFVIPGNPVSHFVTFHAAIRLALETLSGQEPRWSFLKLETAGGEILKPHARETLWPARTAVESGKLLVRPVNGLSSGNPFLLSGVNALIRVNSQSPSGGFSDTLLLDVP